MNSRWVTCRAKFMVTQANCKVFHLNTAEKPTNIYIYTFLILYLHLILQSCFRIASTINFGTYWVYRLIISSWSRRGFWIRLLDQADSCEASISYVYSNSFQSAGEHTKYLQGDGYFSASAILDCNFCSYNMGAHSASLQTCESHCCRSCQAGIDPDVLAMRIKI